MQPILDIGVDKGGYKRYNWGRSKVTLYYVPN